MVLAILTFFVLTDFPEDAKWLTLEERDFMQARLLPVNEGEEELQQPVSMVTGLRSFFSDYKAYLGAPLYFGNTSLPFLSPTYCIATGF